MSPLRKLALTLSAGFALATLVAGPVAAESYDTSDDPIVVTPTSGGSDYVPGGDITVRGNGFGAGTPVNGVMKSDPVFLGTLTANSAGVVEGSFTIPSDAPTGDHHIELQGTDPAGNPRVLSYAITVVESAAANADGSGSGAPDALSFTGSTAIPVAVAGAVLTGLGVTALKFRNRRLGAAA